MLRGFPAFYRCLYISLLWSSVAAKTKHALHFGARLVVVEANKRSVPCMQEVS
jgi:hypothetical protein